MVPTRIICKNSIFLIFTFLQFRPIFFFILFILFPKSRIFTYYNEVYTNLCISKSIDAFAIIHSRILLLCIPDLHGSFTCPDPDPGVVDDILTLPPFDDRSRVADDRTIYSDILPFPRNMLHLLLMRYWGS